MQIKVGTFEVLESGMVQSNGLSPIDFILAENMTFRVVVEKDKGASPSIELLPSGTVLTMRFVNPDAQLHFGPQDPVRIGTLGERDLYCAVRINTYGEFASYSADYTFYLGEATK